MSMFDAFFKKGFNGPKCKTLLKLTIPRIKLLRNRRQIQLKQMRNDIAKLLESGQEATARIRVEHIIREENMMAAHEIIELFCELISVRLPIIEMQGECPLDLKEAISTICFAAPRCSDLPELLQVQMLFASKYGKEFVAAASELMPDCGVNRQVIELLSIRAPPAEIKLKLLKEIAEEHELDWDPSASESEFLKPHEDLLNGPGHFISGSKLPLPKEKHDGSFSSTSFQASDDQSKSDAELHNLDLPEVPKFSSQPPPSVSAPEAVPSQPSSADLGSHNVTAKSTELEEDITTAYCWEPDISAPEQFVATPYAPANTSAGTKSEEKQFLPFVSSPSLSSASSGRLGEPAQSLSRAKNELNADFQDVPAAEKQGEPAQSLSRAKNELNADFQDVPAAEKQGEPAPSISRSKSEINVDFQDVLAAAQTAAETAECAAAAARSAASLAQDRITELLTKRSDNVSGNTRSTFSANGPDWPAAAGTAEASHASDHLPDWGSGPASDTLNSASYDSPKAEAEVSNLKGQVFEYQRSTSLEDDPYFSYPNLFTSQDSNLSSQVSSSADNSRSEHRSN